MTETTIGREPVQIVEIVQPFCSRTYGVAPCAASGPADRKCYNTRATCQDPENFALSAGGLSLFFAKGTVAERGVPGAPFIFPFLKSVSTQPTRINLSAANPNASGLGNRASISLEFGDAQTTDKVVDPYLGDRTNDPMLNGTHWSKWMVRNKYRYNIKIRIYEGYAGQALSAMIKKEYILTDASGPSESGGVRVQGKDILAKIEERKAQAPTASKGVLIQNVGASDTSIAVTGASTSDYPSTGTLRIGDELMTYDATAGDDQNVTFSITARGTDGSTATSHNADDKVQECVRYTDQTVDAIILDLLTRGGVDAAMIDTGGTFTDEVARHLSAYKLSTVISEPVAVVKLVSELQEQVGFLIWWDERDALVKMRAIRGVEIEPDTITSKDHIIKNSFSIKDMPKSRISQVWFFHDLPDETLELKASSFRNVEVVADLPSEANEQYGEPSIRKVFSRWIDSGSLAFSSAFKVVNRYSEVPRQCKFKLDAKDRSLWVGDAIYIDHHLLVDEFGQRKIEQWTIISAEETIPGEEVEYLAENTELYGRVYEWMGSGEGAYPGAATAGFKDAYWGDSNGELSDGSPCARWG